MIEVVHACDVKRKTRRMEADEALDARGDDETVSPAELRVQRVGQTIENIRVFGQTELLRNPSTGEGDLFMMFVLKARLAVKPQHLRTASHLL